MADLNNVKLGTCQVFITPQGGAEIDLGHTIGGVRVNYAPEFKKTKVDKYAGNVQAWLVGEMLSAKVPLAENTLNTLKYAIMQSVHTDIANPAETDRLTIGAQAGKKATEKAFRLRLHPIANATSNKADDVQIYKAFSAAEVEIGYTNENEQITEVTFEGLVDENRADGNLLGMIGDSAS
jgi:hypothetical protein